MALVNCYECGKVISDKATACPDCGAPNISEDQPRNYHRLTTPPDSTGTVSGTAVLEASAHSETNKTLANTRTVAKLLIVFGIIFLIISFNMDISVGYGGDRIFNLQKSSQQTNMLLLGGIFLISGIILFSMAKLKQTPEEAIKEHEEKLKERKNVSSAQMYQPRPKIRPKRTDKKPISHKIGRLSILLFVAISQFTALSILAINDITILKNSGSYTILITAVTALFLFRRTPAVNVMVKTLWGNTVVFSVLLLVYQNHSHSYWGISQLIFLLPHVIFTFAIIWLIGRVEKWRANRVIG